MEMRSSGDDLAASNLFSKLLCPPPAPEDVRDMMERAQYRDEYPRDLRTGAEESSFRVHRAFVVNYVAAKELCVQLEPSTFKVLPLSLQSRILMLVETGLAAGICSAVRLRLGCEHSPGDPSLVWRLLQLLEEFSRSDREDATRMHVIQMLGRILRVVCTVGINVPELKWILRQLQVASAATEPLLLALGTSLPDVSDDRMLARRGAKRRHTPRSIFNFDGTGSGLIIPMTRWSFAQEYQTAFWLRVEKYPGRSNGDADGNSRGAHLVTFNTDSGAGVDFYFEVGRGEGANGWVSDQGSLLAT